MRARWMGLIALAALGGGTAALVERTLDAPADNAPLRFELPAGASGRAVLAELHARGVLAHPRILGWILRLEHAEPRWEAGAYQISAHVTARELLAELEPARALLESLTIVEGWTFAQMRRALDEDAAVGHALRGQDEAAVMRALGHAGQSPEGRFFPDTYHFAAGTSDARLLAIAYERMHDQLASAWSARAAALPLADPDQALILASIVEKETGRADERTLVAAVFENRLRQGMKLQSDPTVIYGLGTHYDGSIHKRDLLADTPFNTYTREGLPPTPIALPGAAALSAVLHPAASEALYFVATGDGAHHFSTTLAEHEVAVQHYLQRIGAR